AERIQQSVAERTWQEKLYNSAKAIKELADIAEKGTPADPKKALASLVQKRAAEEEQFQFGAAERAVALLGLASTEPFQGAAVAVYQARKPQEVPPILKPLVEPGKTLTLRELIKEVKDRINDFAKEREIDGWFKEQVWAKVRNLLWEQMI